jgi:hypothetical protein
VSDQPMRIRAITAEERGRYGYGEEAKWEVENHEGGMVWLTQAEAESLYASLASVLGPLKAKPGEQKPGTVRVRIAVAVDDTGDFQATASCEGGVATDAREAAEDFLYGAANGDPRPFHVVMVEADVPLPVTPTVEGHVHGEGQ